MLAVAAIVIGMLALIAGTVVGVAAVAMIAVARTSRRWPTVPGRIVRSEIRDGRAVIRFVYTVQGEEHEGFDVAAGDWPYRSAGSAVRRVQQYPVGAQVNVYYNPSQPSVAMLVPGLVADVFYLPVVATLLMFVAVSLISWSIWRILVR